MKLKTFFIFKLLFLLNTEVIVKLAFIKIFLKSSCCYFAKFRIKMVVGQIQMHYSILPVRIGGSL